MLSYAKEEIIKASRRHKDSADTKRRDLEFEERDLVRLSTTYSLTTGPVSKLKAKWPGTHAWVIWQEPIWVPAKIVKKLSKTSFKLQSPASWKIRPVIHICRLLPYVWQ